MDVGQTVARWLQIPDAWLIQPFAQLSQGQQKIILIAAALAQRPKLLILDEPLQGCDGIFRRRVLSLVERLAQTIPDEWTLIYITHHPEEVLPCITHVLELERGKCVYQGTRANYETKRKTLMSEQESYEEQQEQFQEFF
jgi:ABC-type molybdenum transport system ATPase subunit/photorepair protein PhrA